VKGDTVSVKSPAAGGGGIPVVSCIAVGAYFDSALGALILVHAVGDARYPHAKATPRAVCEGNKRLHVGEPENDATTLVSTRHEYQRQHRDHKRSKEKMALTFFDLLKIDHFFFGGGRQNRFERESFVFFLNSPWEGGDREGQKYTPKHAKRMSTYMFIIAYMTEGMCIMSVSPPHKKG